MDDIQIFDRSDGRRIGNNDNGESPEQVLKWLSEKDWQYNVVIAKRVGIDPNNGNTILETICNDCAEMTGEYVQANRNGLTS